MRFFPHIIPKNFQLLLRVQVFVGIPVLLAESESKSEVSEKYCLRVTTSELEFCDGYLKVDVTYESSQTDSANTRNIIPTTVKHKRRKEIVNSCTTSPIHTVSFSGSSNDYWCGSFEYSTEGPSGNYYSLKCTKNCRTSETEFNQDPHFCQSKMVCKDKLCSEFVVADAGPKGYGGADCRDGKTCTLVVGEERAGECAKRKLFDSSFRALEIPLIAMTIGSGVLLGLVLCFGLLKWKRIMDAQTQNRRRRSLSALALRENQEVEILGASNTNSNGGGAASGVSDYGPGLESVSTRGSHANVVTLSALRS